MMRKLNMIAAGVAMAVAGTANANLDGAVDATIFMSGASASSNMLREHIVRNVCNSANPINVFVDIAKSGTDVAAALPTLEHTEHWVVQCTAAAGTGANLQGKTFAMYKSDNGGSGTGTTPVAEASAVTFMNADTANCSFVRAKAIQNGGGSTYNLYSCGTNDLVQQIPDGGTSDVEPNKFTGSLAPSAGPFVDLGNLQVKTGPGLIFGPVITKAFRDQLQADQGLVVGSETLANMPSLPKAYVSSLTQGKIQKWADEEPNGDVVNLPASFVGADGIAGTADDVAAGGYTPFVHLCRRTQGSGTHAQHMMHYHGTNCIDGSISMPGQPGLSGGNPAVLENSSSGRLAQCLDHLDKGDGYASSIPALAAGRASFGIGYQSLEKNVALGENWRYIKTDGVAPTLENVFNGDYDQIYFASFQNRNDGSYKTGPLRTNASKDVAAINEFFNSDLDIDATVVAEVNQAFVHSFGASGFMVPSTTAPAAFNINNPRIPWTREATGGVADSCQPLSKKK